MKAINLTGQAPTKRQKLIDLLPLKTPLVVQIFPIYACNLKCNYCIFQIPQEERRFISTKTKMGLAEYYKYIRDMQRFPEKIKTLRFVGIGEPLLHPDIAEMVRYAKLKEIAEKVEIITNAILLTPFISNALVDAGLDRLVVSIQGLSSEKYLEMCDKNIYFDQLVSDIEYFHKYSKKCHVYIKIIDSALENEADKEKFYSIFNNICDSMAIESTVPIHGEVDLPDRHNGQFGQDLIPVPICPQPYYHMQINPDGLVVPCQSFEYPVILGNANIKSVVEIWDSRDFTDFREDHVSGTSNKICKNCKMKIYRMHESDILPMEKMEDLY